MSAASRVHDALAGLRKSYLFEDLTAEDVAPLAAAATTRSLVRGERLCHLGDPADEIWVVLSESQPTVRPRRPRRSEVLDRAGATLALVPPGFDAPCRLPANTTYVGPITSPHNRAPLTRRDAALLAQPGDPWVLLSLSTTLQGQAAALPAMLDAVAALPVRFLLTLGGVLPPSAVNAPSNVAVRGFLPHDLVLPHMAAVICHGGLSTITTALAAGVPIVCIPQGREQPINAARVAASGVGRVIAAGTLAQEIAATLMGLLDDPRAGREARRFAKVIAGLGGGGRATDEVEGLISRVVSHRLHLAR
jgi:UDP:flavonoid glycosyltransferase YjiC (YdhE family)